jgi:hypothetical protein
MLQSLPGQTSQGVKWNRSILRGNEKRSHSMQGGVIYKGGWGGALGRNCSSAKERPIQQKFRTGGIGLKK